MGQLSNLMFALALQPESEDKQLSDRAVTHRLVDLQELLAWEGWSEHPSQFGMH